MSEYPFVLVSFEKMNEFSIKGKIQREGENLKCELCIEGDLSKLVIPKKTEVRKKEGLWNTTCFEIFVKSGNEYVEWNFSPSGEWWMMKFSDYRERMEGEESVFKFCEWKQDQSLSCFVEIPIFIESHRHPQGGPKRRVSGDLLVGISCILETQNQKTHWALKHSSSKPDFHNSENFMRI